MNGPTLVLSAWPPELAALKRRRLPVRLASVGVGPVEAALGTAALLAAHRPARVVFVGTAGIYPGTRGLAVGGAAIAHEVTLACPAVAQGTAYLPPPLPAAERCTARLTWALEKATGLPAVAVACPVAITRTEALARRLARTTGAAIETLELFAVVRACARARIPVAAILGLSNTVGPRAHAEWKEHGARAAAAACAAVEAWVRTSA